MPNQRPLDSVVRVQHQRSSLLRQLSIVTPSSQSSIASLGSLTAAFDEWAAFTGGTAEAEVGAVPMWALATYKSQL
eukprot:3154883-Amphidinium_carterae.2